jgi:hypothetical protein
MLAARLVPKYFKVALADFGPWTLDFGYLTAHREKLLRHLEATDKAQPLELAKYSLARYRLRSARSEM